MPISSPSKVEPDLREDYSTEALANAYNWYNYWQDSAKAKDYTINYLKDIEFSKEKIAAVKRIPENQFINSIGWNARILTLGGSLPDGYQDRMMMKLEKLISADEPVSADDEIKAETEKVVSVQDRTKEKISNYIALLEIELDNNYKDRDYTFNMYEWLSKNEIKPLVARAIADYFIPTYNELIDVLGDGDADLKEGYDHLDKADKIKTLKFLQGIVDDAETFAANVKKATRKPRTPKPKSAEKLAAKVKYKESDDKYKIKSVRPIDIIGSDQLWVFNTKTRYLGIYKSAGPAGLSTKGTKILGYDENESISKKLRKPEKHLGIVSQGTKPQLKKIMDSITAKPKALNGRINSDTVLLRVIKQ